MGRMSSLEFVNLVVLLAMLGGVAAWVIHTERSSTGKSTSHDGNSSNDRPIGLPPSLLPRRNRFIGLTAMLLSIVLIAIASFAGIMLG